MNPHWLSVASSGFRPRHFQSNLQISIGLETIFVILDFLDVRNVKNIWHKKAQELFNVKEIMWMWTSMDPFSPSMNGEFLSVVTNIYIGFFLKLSPCFQGTEIQPHWVPPGNQSQSEKLAESVLEIVGTLPHSLLWQMSHTLPGPNIEEMRQRKQQTCHPDSRFVIMSNATFILWIQSTNQYSSGDIKCFKAVDSHWVLYEPVYSIKL